MKKVIRLTESDLYRIVKRVISEQDPTKRKMDSEWYAEQIKKYISNLMSATQVDTLYKLEDKLNSMFRIPKQKDFLMNKFITPLGQLIDPNNPSETGLKFVEQLYFNNGIKLYKLSSLPSGANNWINKLDDSPVKNTLVRRIQQTKKQDAPTPTT